MILKWTRPNRRGWANIPHGHILPLWMRDFTQEKGGITWNMGILLISKHWGYKQEEIRKWGAEEKSWGNNYRTLGILTIKNSAAYAAAVTTISSHPYGKLTRQDSPMANMQNSARTEQSQDFVTSIDGFFNSQKHQKHGSKTKCCNEVSMFFGNIDERLMEWRSSNKHFAGTITW